MHIPFCKRKCNYCDFCSEAAGEDKIDQYVDALCDEIKTFKKKDVITVNTVFFGGGTPSVINSCHFKKIMNTLRENFRILPDAEITAEVNPGTVTEEKAVAFLRSGVNRISIGAQSIHKNELKILGRIHDCDDFVNTVQMFKRIGIDNLSVDLMYGIPEQTLCSFKNTLKKIIALNPKHVSCYGLIIEEGTLFFENRENLALPTEDEEYEMYSLAHQMLTDAGYIHYEISNYGKEGFLSRHNLKYWHNEEYLGFGLSAHSYFGGHRFYNTSDFDEYFTRDCTKYRKAESLTDGIDPFEYAMLALRLDDGFLLEDYEKLFGKSFIEGKEDKIREFMNLELLKIAQGRISLTAKGFYVSNSILTELL